MVSENHTVRGMTVAHEEAVTADNRLLAIRRPKMDRREFTDDRTVANLDIGDRTILVFEILCLHPDAGIREDLTQTADGRMSVDNGALPDNRTVAENDILSNAGIWSDFDVGAQFRPVFNNRRTVNLHTHEFEP